MGPDRVADGSPADEMMASATKMLRPIKSSEAGAELGPGLSPGGPALSCERLNLWRAKYPSPLKTF